MQCDVDVNIYIYIYIVDLAFSAQCVSHSNGELDFLFENLIYFIKKNDLESPLIFVLFLKGKQNKKEKP